MSIYDKKYQVFVSSTYKDLIKAREEVIKVVLSLYQIPIGMEMFSADNEEQWSVIKSTIDSSDYYLLIVGHRYGSVTKEGLSYTEKEFDYALEQGVPVIAFVKDPDASTKPSERDPDAKRSKALVSFRDKVLNNAMCDFWKNEIDLGQKVAIALTKMFFKTPRIGWVRSNQINSLETTEQITNLVEENRTLREELEKYRGNHRGLPKIEVCVEGVDLVSMKRSLLLDRLEPVDINKVDESLLKYLDVSAVQEYNEVLKKKEVDVKQYRDKLVRYESMRNSNRELTIQVNNNGDAKANDVYVDIVFPDEIVVFEKADLRDLERPKRPEIPENPLEEAVRKRAQNSHLLRALQRSAPLFTTNTINSSFSPNLLKTIANPNKLVWIDAKKNTLTIKLTKVLHTRSITVDEILVAPLVSGQFTAQVKVICDEYKQPTTSELAINVV